jgi:hypothetical protein
MIESYERKAKWMELKKYCHHNKENDFVEMCEWGNGEGFDILFGDKRSISMTWGEWEALQVIVNFKG